MPSLRRAIASLVRKPFDFDLDAHWEQRAQRFRICNRLLSLKGGPQWVLIGDSLTEFFPRPLLWWVDPRCVNRGICGDHLDGARGRNMLARLEPALLAPRPQRIVLLGGINDLEDFGARPEVVLARYARLLGRLRERHPNAELVCQSLLPVSDKHAHLNESVCAVNAGLVDLVREYGASWLDLHRHFVDADQQLMAAFSKDGLHLTPRAYVRWARLLRRRLRA